MIEINSIKQPRELWEIFHLEFQEHLKAIHNYTEKSLETFDTEDFRKLSARLHRIKGGLGFIGFQDLCSKVEICENLLKEKSKNTLGELSKIQIELENLFLKVSEAVLKK